MCGTPSLAARSCLASARKLLEDQSPISQARLVQWGRAALVGGGTSPRLCARVQGEPIGPGSDNKFVVVLFWMPGESRAGKG